MYSCYRSDGYACYRSDGYAVGLNLAAASILNQNPIFEMASGKNSDDRVPLTRKTQQDLCKLFIGYYTGKALNLVKANANGKRTS